MADNNSSPARNHNSSKVYHTFVGGSGKVTRKNKNCSRFVMSNSGDVTLDHVEGNGVLDEQNTGGKEFAMSGQHTDEVKKHAMDKVFHRSANTVKVALKFSDRSKKYEGEYELDKTIYDVIADIMDNTDKKVREIQHSKTKEILDEDLTIEHLLKKEYLDKLTAILE